MRWTRYLAIAVVLAVQVSIGHAEDTRLVVAVSADPATNQLLAEYKVFKVADGDELLHGDAADATVFTILKSNDWPKGEPWVKLRIEGVPGDTDHVVSINLTEFVLPRYFGSRTSFPLPTIRKPVPSKDDVKLYSAQGLQKKSPEQLVKFYLAAYEVARARVQQRLQDQDTEHRTADVVPVWGYLVSASLIVSKLDVEPLPFTTNLANWLLDASDDELASNGLTRVELERTRDALSHGDAPFFSQAWSDIIKPTCSHPALLQRYYSALRKKTVEDRQYIQHATGVDLVGVVNAISECLLVTIDSDQQSLPDLQEQLARITDTEQLLQAGGAADDPEDASGKARVANLEAARTRFEDRLSGKITPKHP